MISTIIIGKIIAPYLLVTGLGFILSGKFYSLMIENADKSDPVLVNLSGMVHFLIGMTILVNHFLWGSLLEIIITILGFAFVFKGGFLIALPRLTLKSNQPSSINRLRVMGAGFIAAGLVIGYLSYFA
jgi:uncharacterized protein YjeT (DUF2065 family)